MRLIMSAQDARGPMSMAPSLVTPEARQPVDLAPEAGDGLVDDLLDRLQLVDQPGRFAGGARSVVDVAVDVEHVDQAAARQALARALGNLDRIGRAQAARAGAWRVVGHDGAA